MVPRSVITKQSVSTEKPIKNNKMVRQDMEVNTKEAVVPIQSNNESHIEDPYDPMHPNRYEDYLREKEEEEQKERKRLEREVLSSIPKASRSQIKREVV